MKDIKLILDATCGSRTIWFDKHHPAAVYMDAHPRKQTKEWKSSAKCGRSLRTIEVKPDIVADFTSIPFPKNTFALVVFDPPHLVSIGDESWMKAKYGRLDGDWRKMLHDGFAECMRVLQPHGTLIFKWSEIQIPVQDILKVIGHTPLFGHRSGKRSNTHWLTFMKGV